jgi:hypothetical protein
MLMPWESRQGAYRHSKAQVVKHHYHHYYDPITASSDIINNTNKGLYHHQHHLNSQLSWGAVGAYRHSGSKCYNKETDQLQYCCDTPLVTLLLHACYTVILSCRRSIQELEGSATSSYTVTNTIIITITMAITITTPQSSKIVWCYVLTS